MNSGYARLQIVFYNCHTACNNSVNTFASFLAQEAWSPADRRMVSQILATSYILIQKLFPHMGYCFATDISSETAHYSWQKRISLIFSQLHIAEIIGRMVSRLT
jgi:hypothetical protein